MSGERIDRWPCGERPVYFATLGAWDLLDLLGRQDSRGADVKTALESASLRDVRGAYFLTRDLDALKRRDLLFDGDDAGRARRIQIRKDLRRAFDRLWLKDEATRHEREAEAVRRSLSDRPPERPGWRRLTPSQVLEVAGSLQPLEVRVRRLLEVDRGVVDRVRSRLVDPSATQKPLPKRPHGPQADHLAWVLDLALEAALEPTPFPNTLAIHREEAR